MTNGGEKPCPFCGSKNVQSIVNRAEKIHPYIIMCSDCGMRTAYHGNYQQCLAAWNARATPDLAAVRDEALEEAVTAARDAMVAHEWPPQDGDIQIDEVLAAIRALQQKGPSNG